MDSVQEISQRSSGGRGPSTGNSACLCVTHEKSVWLVEVSSNKAWTVMPTLISPFSSRIWCGRHNLSWRERFTKRTNEVLSQRKETGSPQLYKLRTFSGMRISRHVMF